MPRKKDVIEPLDASFDEVSKAVLGKELAKTSKTTTNKVNGDNPSVQPKRELIKDIGAMQVQGVEIHIIGKGEEDYISLTDMAGGFDGEFVPASILILSNSTELKLELFILSHTPRKSIVLLDIALKESHSINFRNG